ncbi:MAG: response regulator transcription factor [Deltaproteobacteria bacterium]|nr:response regulator transcription factor [Deltaproteobacteria bacterium]
MAPLILIVDDERDLVATLEYNLQRDGYQTRTAYDGASALEAAQRRPLPDLVLLDLMLPDIQGTEVCRRMRSDDRLKHIPVVMLTAKGEEIDRVVGFELGADDYVVKPFSTRELMLRLRAVLRRAQTTTTAETGLMRLGPIEIDIDAHRVHVDGEEVKLTALEFRLLSTLLSRAGRAQTREQLLEDVWEMTADLTTRTVDTHVKRLRQKLGAAGDQIETLRGVGYRFRKTSGESDG